MATGVPGPTTSAPKLYFQGFSEEAPGIPCVAESDVEEDFANEQEWACEAGTESIPSCVEVCGSHGKNGYPALSPRSGMMKRKEGDHLRLNGLYIRRSQLHNGAPCWEKPPDLEPSVNDEENTARVLFRSRDGSSWVIDEEAHDGHIDALVLARVWSTASFPFDALEEWCPTNSLKIVAVRRGGACSATASGTPPAAFAPPGRTDVTGDESQQPSV
eukprot:TRINITY_DN19118_c0_g1_i1.p1 TRINITY_DN19118_c0_g1~~TRINITY_DN19118_c0_g1_i1.p1  ORF type:complete len:216 (-),score=29.52 TRINITY_DN19118_c0_g1_i1:34-681(-)